MLDQAAHNHWHVDYIKEPNPRGYGTLVVALLFSPITGGLTLVLTKEYLMARMNELGIGA